MLNKTNIPIHQPALSIYIPHPQPFLQRGYENMYLNVHALFKGNLHVNGTASLLQWALPYYGQCASSVGVMSRPKSATMGT